MFTGIVEEIGRVTQASISQGGSKITIRCQRATDGTSAGDSVAVNGACLTVVSKGQDAFTVDVTPETLSKTTLSRLKVGSTVNLERAMRLGDRLGGHLVTGHIDGVCRITEMRPAGISVLIAVSLPRELLPYVIPRGSIALDGISLTVARKTEGQVVVSVIPHTRNVTTLGEKKVGDDLNVETDIVSRYVESLLGERNENGLRESLLKAGFLT